MALLTKQAGARAANDLTLTTSSDSGDTFLTTGSEYLLVVAASTLTITIVTAKTVDGEAVDDKTIEVASGKTALLGPWPVGIYGDGDGIVNIDAGADFANAQYALLDV